MVRNSKSSDQSVLEAWHKARDALTSQTPLGKGLGSSLPQRDPLFSTRSLTSALFLGKSLEKDSFHHKG